MTPTPPAPPGDLVERLRSMQRGSRCSNEAMIDALVDAVEALTAQAATIADLTEQLNTAEGERDLAVEANHNACAQIIELSDKYDMALTKIIAAEDSQDEACRSATYRRHAIQALCKTAGENFALAEAAEALLKEAGEVVEEAVEHEHNSFEPDNQSERYKRLRRLSDKLKASQVVGHKFTGGGNDTPSHGRGAATREDADTPPVIQNPVGTAGEEA